MYHQNSNSNLNNISNNKSIDISKISENANISNNNLIFNIDKSISTSKFNTLNDDINNPNNNNFRKNSNNINSNINIDSPEKLNKDGFLNSNLNKFLNNSSCNKSDRNTAFVPTLDDILFNDNDQINQKNLKSDNFSNLREGKYYEPNSLISHNQKFPTDMSTYSHKFLSVSKNLSK